MLNLRVGSIFWFAASLATLAVAAGLLRPFHDLPKLLQGAGTVASWSMLAIEDVIRSQSGLGQVSPKLLILAADGLVCFALGRFLLRDREGRHS